MDRAGPAFFVGTIAGMLAGRQHVAVGANSPIPASAALLARALSGGKMRISILGSRKHNNFTGLADLFDCATTGRLDAFFLTPGQIDGQANINMIGVGDYPRLKVRWPGSHGSPLVYMMIPNIILFRPDHLRRTLVPKVDFISAPGVSPANVFRRGGPSALLTSLGLFAFDRERARFRLERVHPGHTQAEILENTGFNYDVSPGVRQSEPPSLDQLRAICARVGTEVAEIYPQFASELVADAEMALSQAAA
jgi:glutaconate CoA-transferase subunit B